MKDNNVNSRKVAFVIGGSSGIGLETSLTLAENKFRTYATIRNIDKAANVLELAKKRNVVLEIAKLDVNDDYSILFISSLIIAAGALTYSLLKAEK
jgi:NAD(P)-dependent dehydrogenase (short-subunit alcohol dehydrogenase family)